MLKSLISKGLNVPHRCENRYILMRIEGKIDSLQKDVRDLKVGQAVLTGKVEGMENRLNPLEGKQKYQFWALIVLLARAIVKTFFSLDPPLIPP